MISMPIRDHKATRDLEKIWGKFSWVHIVESKNPQKGDNPKHD